MKVKEYLEKTYKENNYNVRSRVVCSDGFSISIQGGTSMHYCHPRKLCNVYEKVELGYPSEPEELITTYAEGPEKLTETIYGYVPIEIVEEVVEKHGGIVQ